MSERAWTLTPAVSGERREIDERRRAAQLLCGRRRPAALLIHSINAAASAYEVKPIYDAMRRHKRRVYSVELPGFGFSDRSDRPYTDPPVHRCRPRHAGPDRGRDRPQPSMRWRSRSVASSWPAPPWKSRSGLRTLAFVTPDRLQPGTSAWRPADQASREVPGLYRIFSFPSVGPGLLQPADEQAKHPLFPGTPGVPNRSMKMVEYDYLTTHQPGAGTPPSPSSPAACSAAISATSTNA